MKRQTGGSDTMGSRSLLQGAVRGWMALAAVLLAALPAARANDVQVSNVGWAHSAGDGQSYVTFDLSWANSWRAQWTEAAGDNVTGSELAVGNWDAAWVFVKFRAAGSTAGYAHATLSTDAAAHVIPAAAGDVAMTNTVGLTAGRTPGEGVGVFIHRAGNGNGNLALTSVKLRWLHGADGVAPVGAVDFQVHAIEMVYVPQGAFKVGSGGTEANRFYAGGTVNDPFMIASEGAITVGTASGNLYYRNDGGGVPGDRAGPIPAAFPKGYNAFYCMKYEITQGQYTSFLNALTNAQATARYPGSNPTNRHTISVSAGVYSATAPYVACNWLKWADAAAYADWAGLRPMTELEYEKACRGPRNPTADEYVWGPAAISSTGGEANYSNLNAANESVSQGNAIYLGSNPGGPARVGIFATASTTRAQAGASYWGIMELSGNLWDQVVTIGEGTAGRAFTGLHGNGALTTAGDANVANWPPVATGVGNGLRGSAWNNASSYTRVSDRIIAAVGNNDRASDVGRRAVRSAP